MNLQQGFLGFDQDRNPLYIDILCRQCIKPIRVPFTDKNLITWNFRTTCPECKQLVEVSIIILRTEEEIRRN